MVTDIATLNSGLLLTQVNRGKQTLNNYVSLNMFTHFTNLTSYDTKTDGKGY